MKKIKYLMVPLFVFLFILTGCGEKKEENKTNDTEKKENVKETIKVEEKNNRLYVNGNLVDFYTSSMHKENYTENEFYCYNEANMDTGYEFTILDDFVYVEFNQCNHLLEPEYYLINRTGKIIKEINGDNNNIELSTTHAYITVNEAKENDLYLLVSVDNALYHSGTICEKINSGHGNDIVEYVDKITYIGDDEFKLEKAVETKTYNDYSELAQKENYHCLDNVYYKFDDSQEERNEYLEVFKQLYNGKYSMVIKYEESLDNTIKSICIYDNEKLTCFTDDEKINNSLANYFGANNCGNTDNGYECHNNNFTCFKNNKGITCSSKMNGNCTGYVDQADNAMTMCY